MPVNRNALIRYRTIDKCLQNHYRLWTLEDLIDACSDALYEFEGIDKGISKRTVQMDIQMMRSDKLGYNAPIIVKERKYYCYEDPDYTISNIPLSEQDLGMLNEVVGILRQFKGFSHFNDFGDMVNRLEDKIHTTKTNSVSVIDFEKNENLKGLEFLDIIYHAILDKQPLTVTYQSFKARKASEMSFHPYLLKEYRNRWFVLGVKGAKQLLLTLALDRMQKVEKLNSPFIQNDILDPETYFMDLIGVTDSNVRPQVVEIEVDRQNAPYVLTKPLHHSQEVIKKGKEGITIQIKVKMNFELEREILGFGESMKVLKPKWLVKRISSRLKAANQLYEDIET